MILRQEEDGSPMVKQLETHSLRTKTPRQEKQDKSGRLDLAQTTYFLFPKPRDLPEHMCAEKAPQRPKGSHIKGCSTHKPLQ